ncbi:MAG: hypothetical protein CVV10_07865 [Gammaproteobacteria bacterium HGW-Gammaproteobacteria-14]|nr:MAG: hypothetical protein CVV10_07865 [Gammaproteobacteria bacterium HGW-Gammaproteobacteria-14]
MARGHSRSTDNGEALRPLGRAWIRTFARGRQVRPVSLQTGSPAIASQRDMLDLRAAWNRWHVPEVAAAFEPQERPFFDLFDRVRVERLAAIGWPGMASNLADTARLAPSSDTLRPLYLCARNLAEGKKHSAQVLVEEWVREHEPSRMRDRLMRWRRALGGSVSQAIEYEKFQALATALGELLAVEAWDQAVLEDSEVFASRVQPLVKRCAETLAPSSQDLSAEKISADHSAPSSLLVDPSEGDPDASLEVDGQAESEAPVSRAYPEYEVYSQAQDEIASAKRWYQPEDRQGLDRLQTIDRRRARQLAHRLQRRLQVARRRTWQFDLEEGLIDNRRIARLVKTGSDPRVFRSESECPVPEAGVSLLVDLSGSMRSDRRLSAALAIDLAVHVLEICGIQCEVLGYTTRYGEENPIERRWQRSDQSGQPGRLNAVRHIVFKSARQPWRRCRQYLGLLLRKDFGYENIDGEALHWAAQRLFSLDVSRRILLVLSDGAPFDRATAAANGRGFLCDHLRAVVQRLDASPLHLLALGAGSDVSRFYRRAVVLKNPEAVAETLFEQLGDLLTSPKAQRDSR